jgi:hypothetical protein
MAKPLLPDDLGALIEPLLPPPKPRRRDHPGRKPVGTARPSPASPGRTCPRRGAAA